MRADAIDLALPSWQLRRVRDVASGRQRAARAKGYQAKDGPQSAEPRSDLIGAMGECAVARWLGVWWSPRPGDIVSPDVDATVLGLGPIEVRTRSRLDRDLIIREKDREVPHVLAIATGARVVLVGWMLPSEARRDEWRMPDKYRGDEYPAWLAPQAELHSMDELRRRKVIT